MRSTRVKKHLLFIFLLLIFVISFFLAVRFLGVAQNAFDVLLAESGYKLNAIIVKTEKNIDKDIISKKFSYLLGKNTFTLPIFSIRRVILSLPWCSDVLVSKKLPGTLVIDVKEHKPFALFNGSHIVTMDFHKIVSFNLKKHKDIDLFNIYSSSHKEAKDFLDDLRQNLPSALFNQIKCAEHISKRRWNVKTKDDLLIKLPEKQATKTLIKLNKYLGAKFGPKKIIDARAKDAIYIE